MIGALMMIAILGAVCQTHIFSFCSRFNGSRERKHEASASSSTC
jgi:hypothetical protein